MHLTKYSASGNDFLLCHTFTKSDKSQLAIELCDRHNGIGADGLVVLMPHEKYDFEWDFYNSDGSVASMCGNASRAAGHYAFHNNLCKSPKSRFLTGAGVIETDVDGNIVETRLTEHKIIQPSIHEDGFEWVLVDTGVPHLVAIVENLELFDKEMARTLRHKYNANVNMACVDGGKLYVRTFERGVEDETLACGTGMVASFVVARMQQRLQESVKVYPKSGEELEVSLRENRLYFKGKVKRVFEVNLYDK